jgi:predicted nucleic acid-binding protein
MKIIVDSNIVFSAILNTKSIIGDLLLNSEKLFQFWTCYYLINEIDRHWVKLKRISKLDEGDLLEAQLLIYKNITFIDEGQIPKFFRIRAYNLLKGIDINDIAFIALNEFQGSLLWTGDKQLTNGLRNIGYQGVITTEEMIILRSRLESK